MGHWLARTLKPPYSASALRKDARPFVHGTGYRVANGIRLRFWGAPDARSGLRKGLEEFFMDRTAGKILGILLMATGCVTSWSAPTQSAPTPDYIALDAPYQEVWDAAIDFLVDTGTEWEFLHNEMRTARINTLVARGPWREGTVHIPNEGAQEYADCGLRNGAPGAGWGNLWASVAIRVRAAPDGSGLLKVVIPDMWQVQRDEISRVSCVSKGILESRIRRGIEDRVTPTVRTEG